jgi:hypothetical protein
MSRISVIKTNSTLALNQYSLIAYYTLLSIPYYFSTKGNSNIILCLTRTMYMFWNTCTHYKLRKIEIMFLHLDAFPQQTISHYSSPYKLLILLKQIWEFHICINHGVYYL